MTTGETMAVFGPVTRVPVERASANDLVQFSLGSDPASTQVGALMILEAGRPLELAAVRAALEERVAAAPRLRQRLRKVPLGCGRPVWVDDPSFGIARHVSEVVCPEPGGERQLLDLVATVVTTSLPADRPLWSATLVQGLADGRAGLILAFHHVLVDGVGGLAVLGHLVDGPADGPTRRFPEPAPSRRQLMIEAFSSRLRTLRGLRSVSRRLVAAGPQLRAGMGGRAPRCSLNRPTGPRRRLTVARTDLAAIRTVAHACDGTVNDVVLTAVTGALHRYLLGRNERLDRVVVSVPVSGHAPGERDRFGNNVGVVPVALPTAGARPDRLTTVATLTRLLRSGERGATATVLAPVFRVLGALGVVGWYIDRQRRVNTFLTNLRGPTDQQRFLGATITDLVAVNAIAGNVTVAFGALSYHGALAVTVVADPHNGPDVEHLAELVQRELDAFTRMANERPRGRDGDRGSRSVPLR
jgi:diacylglycerol O-acyltransferase / wax synthase